MNLLFDGEYNQLSFEIKCNVIKSLSDYGIILETTRIISEIDPPEKIYYAGIQPIIEFLRANNIAHKIIEKNTNSIKNISQNILNLISLIVLEEKDILIILSCLRRLASALEILKNQQRTNINQWY